MFGGTAKAYANYPIEGFPFKEGKFYYVNVKTPPRGRVKKVRWYQDAEHAAYMPIDALPKLPPFHKVFGFESREDTIIAIKRNWVFDDEKELLKGWNQTEFLGGIYYAPKNKEVPNIKHVKKIFYPTWSEFVQGAEDYLLADEYADVAKTRWAAEFELLHE